MEGFIIEKGQGYDFHIIQNFVIQLVSDGYLNAQAYLLYGFYKSLDGFSRIQCSYDYISKNTKLSKGAISKGNKLLEKCGLIKVQRNGQNSPNRIFIQDGNKLPRRELKKLDHSGRDFAEEVEFEPVPVSSPSERSSEKQPVHDMNTGSSSGESIHIGTNRELNRNNTTTGEDLGKKLFIKEFKDYWCRMNQTDVYRINDDSSADEIDNYKLARKLIPVLWLLDEKDKWVKKSNHSMKVFVKEYNNGNLQTHYPKTGQFYKDKNREFRNT